MEVNFNTIQPDIPKEHMYDGLHLSAYGVAMMETTIRDSFKKKWRSSSFFYKLRAFSNCHIFSLFNVNQSVNI